MNHETVTWINFIKDLKRANYYISIKGGNVIGLKLLKNLTEVYETIPLDVYRDFINLNLIKDWDFYLVLKENEKVHDVLNMAKKYDIHNEAETMTVLRKKDCYKVDGEPLFEMSVKTLERFSDFEIPLTTLELIIEKENMHNLYTLIDYFNNKEEDVEKITRIIKKFNVCLFPIVKGLFELDIHNFDQATIYEGMFNIIRQIGKTIHEKQFLVAQIIQPDRLFYRLIEKNIPKSNRIWEFINRHHLPTINPHFNIPIYNWLLNESYIMDLVNRFIDRLINETKCIYQKYEPKLISIHTDIKDKENQINNLEKKDKKLIRDKIRLEDEYIRYLYKYINATELFFKGVNIGRMTHKMNTFNDHSIKTIIKLKPKFYDEKFMFKMMSRKVFQNNKIVVFFNKIKSLS